MVTISYPNLILGHTLADLQPTTHNGPGWRIALWTQGCSLRCTPECLSPHLTRRDGGFEYPVEDVADAVFEVATSCPYPVEGVTVLGGEPTDQLQPLVLFLQKILAQGLSTMVYSGHMLEVLRGLPGASALLEEIDLLVDGPYIDALYDGTLAWRGSSNQQVHCLTDRYTPKQLRRAFESQGKGYALTVSPDGRVSISGLQSRAAAREAEALLGLVQGQSPREASSQNNEQTPVVDLSVQRESPGGG